MRHHPAFALAGPTARAGPSGCSARQAIPGRLPIPSQPSISFTASGPLVTYPLCPFSSFVSLPTNTGAPEGGDPACTP